MCDRVCSFVEDESLAKIIFHHADWTGDIDTGKLRDKAFIPRKGDYCFSLIRASFLDIHFTKDHIVKEMIKPPDKRFYGFSIIPFNEIQKISSIKCKEVPEGHRQGGLDEHANACLYDNGECCYIEKQKRSKVPEAIQLAIEKLLNIAKKRTVFEEEDKREYTEWCGENVPEFEGRNIYI